MVTTASSTASNADALFKLAPAAAAADAKLPLFPMWVYVAVAVFGALLVVLVLFVVFLRPAEQPFNQLQANVARVALALGSACVAVLIPGMTNLDLTLPGLTSDATQAALHVAGPLTIFCIVFFYFNTKSLTARGQANAEADGHA